jgi:membrane protein
MPAFVGAVVASVLWEFLKKGYLLYTSNALNYNLIYGSLAALPLFMIWLFISWMVLLAGAEISFVWQNYRIINESRKTMVPPLQFYEALGLEILLETTRCFTQGGPPFKPHEFAYRRKIPQYLVSATVDKLIAHNLVASVDGDIILAKDPDILTVEDVLEAIRIGGAQNPPFIQSGNLLHLLAFLNVLEKPSQELKKEWSIQRLLTETEKERIESQNQV